MIHALPRSLWWLWFTLLFARLVLALSFDVSYDEAYYWVWSLKPQLSYYDHPAMVSWLMSAGTVARSLLETLFSTSLPSAVRIPFVVLSHLTLLVADQIFCSIKRQQSDGPSAALRAQLLALLCVSPFFGLGGFVATPDLPFLFFASVLGLRLIHLQSLKWTEAIVMGGLLGLGIISKYHMVLMLPAVLVAVFHASADWRSRLKFLGLGIVFTLLFSAPLTLWNLANDFVSIRFQTQHGLGPTDAEHTLEALRRLGEYVLVNIALATPGLALLYRKKFRAELSTTMHVLVLFPLLFFALTSLRAPVELNWPIAGHYFALIAVFSIASTRRWIFGFSALWVALFAVAIHQAYHPADPLGPVEAHKLKTYEFVRYKALAENLAGEPLVFGSTYQMAGQLSFWNRKFVSKMKGLDRKDQFDVWPDSDPTGKTGRLVVERNQDQSQNIVEALHAFGLKVTERTEFSEFILYRFEPIEAARD